MLRAQFCKPFRARSKIGADFVTDADLAAEAAVLSILEAASPHTAVLSEERGPKTGTDGRTWVVDPLDGTYNFALGIPQFGVSIALLDGAEPILGVIYNPISGVLWAARRDRGARRNRRRVGLGAPERPPDALLLVCGYSVPSKLAEAARRSVANATGLVLTNWAPSLDWCLVAEGRAAALVSIDSEAIDQLAGWLIATESGVTVTDFDGGPAGARGTRLVASRNPELHRRLVGRLARLVRAATPASVPPRDSEP